jgi:type II secretory ATPase GspE/PulE/Tfp pilus assembly ATPase PilB-like protein
MESAYLYIRTPEGEQKLPLGDEPITVGRHPENVIVLTDVKSSRFHCTIHKTQKGVAIRDLNSRNGTKVNGRPISAAFLDRGDVVTIGATQMRLLLPGDAEDIPVELEDPDAGAIDPPPLEDVVAEYAHPAAPPPRLAGSAAAVPPQSPAGVPPRPPAATKPPPQLEILDDDEEIIDLGDPSVEVLHAGRQEVDDKIEVYFRQSDEPGESPVDFSVSSGREDDEKFLPVLAESLPNKPFGVGTVALLNARGQVVHEAPDEEGDRKRKGDNPAESVSVLRYIILISSRTRATDIHIEPKNEDFQLRLRIDGNMVDIIRLSKNMGTRLTALVKILCELDLHQRNVIQEGHFSTQFPDRRVDYRVSFAPSMFGQKLVIRILDTANAPLHLSEMQLPLWMLEEIQKTTQEDSGLMVVVGPTGSGKTTTLYSTLRDCGVEHRNVVTIEDPVEIEIPGVTQVPVNNEQGNSFPNLLRSMLRQDPDVIMVGEIRDQETARIAMQAAMTGHLVLTTLHARDTIGAVFRLLDLGVEPYLVASSLQLAVTQRLARLLCPYCKRAVRPTPQQLEKFGKRAQTVKEIFVPGGCPSCLKTGYSGRRAFFEMLVVNDEVRNVIQNKATPKDLEIALSTTKFTKLGNMGYQLVALGLTAYDEVERAVGR